MSNFSDFIGGGGSASFPTFFLHKSATWVPPQDGNVMIHVIGGGGSGSASTSTVQLQSGAAGGYCRKNSLAVTTSGSFTVVVGAGGTPTFHAVGAGTAGGNTTVAGTGLSSTLTATGGAGGALSSGTYTTGGVGSNGDFNSNGGRGGSRAGGGAVGLTGTGADGTAGPFYLYTACGGRCDILGDFYSSSLGQISGGIGGQGMTKAQYYDSNGFLHAEPLGGGGSLYSNYDNSATGGNGSIGGGGGWKFSSGSTPLYSGRGGEGCVVIQYIP
tara:strand:- start:58 stop:870 length:813 start_codon:yes stop_codon:yes gene_type:complete